MDSISLSQFEDITGIKKPSLSRLINQLVRKNVIIKDDNEFITKYGLNKNYLEWEPLPKKVTTYSKKSSLKELTQTRVRRIEGFRVQAKWITITKN